MEKDLLIYNELCKYGQQVFEWLMARNSVNAGIFKDFKDKTAKTLADKYGLFYHGEYDEFTETQITINVDTFHCEFKPLDVFRLMVAFKRLAKGAKDCVFEYEEETGDKIATVDVTFDNSVNAKKLSSFAEKKEEIRPQLRCVLMEVNTSTNEVNFVATNGHILSVISNSVETIQVCPDKKDIIRALFDATTWKNICDYAKSNGNSVDFEMYKSHDENYTKAVVTFEDKKFFSVIDYGIYPNWHNTIVKGTDRVMLEKNEIKAFHAFLKTISKRSSTEISISYYKGSNLLYCDYEYLDYGEAITKTFRLESTAKESCFAMFDAKTLANTELTGFGLLRTSAPCVALSKISDYMIVMPYQWEGFDSQFVAEREMKCELATA